MIIGQSPEAVSRAGRGQEFLCFKEAGPAKAKWEQALGGEGVRGRLAGDEPGQMVKGRVRHPSETDSYLRVLSGEVLSCDT